MNSLATIPIESVVLRAAAAEDCEAVWRWNFAPDVRAQSKRGHAVAFAEHARWFQRRLADAHEPIWVIEEYFAPVGVVRLDTAPSGLARISVALATAARGRGIGKAAITAACQLWGRPIFAEIFAHNLASRACFEACGFHSVVECDGLLTYHWDPET
jgi:UDP-2,4-diacetamido-2,4,6-trideoxy-beta-L-altropyranose hydrolase